jgi:hypothetical protein
MPLTVGPALKHLEYPSITAKIVDQDNDKMVSGPGRLEGRWVVPLSEYSITINQLETLFIYQWNQFESEICMLA